MPPEYGSFDLAWSKHPACAFADFRAFPQVELSIAENRNGSDGVSSP
jgi:hypothetical protein